MYAIGMSMADRRTSWYRRNATCKSPGPEMIWIWSATSLHPNPRRAKLLDNPLPGVLLAATVRLMDDMSQRFPKVDEDND
ncbi:hypothetical protein SeLEV6574_g08548 [Synchytrium endobioticum]|uniref:Uncharacterized protein n=1 Tax=Synchytrium endobioticum TaxID=286115 RepID=A0A507BZQ2_9FUNG|nr:hypothetical protein SeLEV6574_g08548 [Synchytrium endobioticum]